MIFSQHTENVFSYLFFDVTLTHCTYITMSSKHQIAEIAEYVASKGSQTITSIRKSIIMVNVANVLNKCINARSK